MVEERFPSSTIKANQFNFSYSLVQMKSGEEKKKKKRKGNLDKKMSPSPPKC